MNILVIVLFLIAAFHFCLYYCNMDFFTLIKKKDAETSNDKEFIDLSETKEILEKHLKELKQYNTHG
jgi:hypothetical protein